MDSMSDKIASVEQGALFTLSASPNFVVVKGEKKENSTPQYIDFQVSGYVAPMDAEKVTQDDFPIEFYIKETRTEVTHTFKGTCNEKDVATDVFFVSEFHDQMAENIRRCFLRNSFLRNNFDILILYNLNDLAYTTIRLTPLGVGSYYSFEVTGYKNEKLDKFNPYVKVIPNPFESKSDDRLTDMEREVEVELEIYTNTGVRPGEIGAFSDSNLGKRYTSLSKAYYGDSVWFDVNTVSQTAYSESVVTSVPGKWCDGGTVEDFRFIARRFDGLNSQPFFYSSVYYVVTGYNRNLEYNTLMAYVYNTAKKKKVKSLTRQPELPHVKGQTQFFNFILSTPDWNANVGLGIIYKLYTQSKTLIATLQDLPLDKYAVVNSIKLTIDEHLEQYDNVGFVEVYLSHGGRACSYPLSFRVLPDCMYLVHDFAFLNALGGWSSFNFGNQNEVDFKTKSDVIYRTQTPDYKLSDSIETVFDKSVDEKFAVQTMPISSEVADWLKEISSSVAVYELSTGRYVVIDELNIKHTTKEELFRIEMKYHYSDSYNGNLVND